jgi:two-component system OmpR family sensor kinase
MISIRRRLMLGTVLAVAVTSALASGAAWLSVRSHLITAVGADLQADAVRVLGQLRQRGTEIHWAGIGAIGTTLAAFDGWWAVLDASGTVQATSTNDATFLASMDVGACTLPDGQAGRVARADGPILVAGGRGRWGTNAQGEDARFTLLVARSDAVLEASLAAVGWALGTATAVAAVLAGAAAWVLARAVVRPVDRIARAIAAARPEDERIALTAGEVPGELRPVVERADAFLIMARDLVRRERQTAGNIAHELRTPLAGLAAILDHILARDREAADYRQALERSRVIVTETAGIIEQLLLLTRLESGREPVRPVVIGLMDPWEDVLAGVRAAAGQRALALPEAGVGAGIQVHGDRAHLQLVLRNLLDNAVAHAPEGSAITMTLERMEDSLVLRLSNPSPGLSEAMLPRLDEAFWRGEEGRGSTGRHAGLGLALCRRLAILNGWELGFSLAAGRFTVSLRLPKAPRGPLALAEPGILALAEPGI